MPWPVGLVVKKGSKISFLFSSGIPGPPSAIAMQTLAPSTQVRTVTVPFCGDASMALSRMLVHTWLRPTPQVERGGRPGAKRFSIGQLLLAKLMAEDDQRALDAVVHIELMPLRLVFIRVLLHRSDQVGHAGDAFFNRSHQAGRWR